jgi:hypothetical protein
MKVYLVTSLRWSASRPCRFTLPPGGKSPWYPLDKRLGEPQSQSGQCEENFSPYRDSNSDPSVIQPIASQYNGYGILAQRSIHLALLNSIYAEHYFMAIIYLLKHSNVHQCVWDEPCEDLTVVTRKNAILRNVMSCNLIYVYQYFKRTYYLQIQDHRVSCESRQLCHSQLTLRS